MAQEKNFENKIKKYLKDNGAWFLKYWAGASYTKAGIPDILACINGYFVAIEVKASNGRPSELQLYNLREIDKAGGFGFLLYPKGYEDFVDFIKDLLHGNIDRNFYEMIRGW